MGENLEADMCDGLSEVEKKEYSISELISFFKSAFRPEDFKKAEQILRLREEKLKIKDEMVTREMSRHENLERELGVYRNRCIELEEGKRKSEEDFRVSFETALGDLDLKKLSVEEELAKYRIRCGNLEEHITRLEEDHRVVCGREKIIQEKVEGLEEELKKEREARESFVQLKIESMDLEFSKKSVESETDDYKKRCGELEARVLRLEEENSVLRGRGLESCEKIEVEPKEMLDEVSCGENGTKGLSKTSKNREGTNGGRGKDGKMSNCDDINYVSSDVGSACHSPVSGSGVLHVSDSPCIITPCKSLENVKVEKIDDSLLTNEGYGRQVQKQLLFKEEKSCIGKMAPTMITDEKSMLGDVIMISDDEDETNIMPTSNSSIRNAEMTHVSMTHNLGEIMHDGKETAPQKSSKRNHSDQRNEGAVKENSSSCEENFLLYSTPKRKRASKVITSDSEDDDDDDVGKTPIGKTAPQKSSKRNHSDQRIEDAVKENSSSCEENFPLYSTPKRKRALKVITSDSEDDDEDNGDKTPIGKLNFKKLERLSASKVIASDIECDDDDDKNPIGLKFKKLERLTERFREPTESTVNHVSPPVASTSDNVEESITPSRRRLVPLRLCEEIKHGTKITPLDHSVRENVLPKTEGVILGTTGTSYHIPEKTTMENGSEDEVEDLESESEGESLGGFIVEGSSGSKSECASADASENELDGDFDLGQILASIRGYKDSSKLEYEADLLSSFSRDPELCMKAVCALYRQQTSEEKSFKSSLHVNNRGFNKFDALKGSMVAQFLTDGDPAGPLKKSVQELEKHDRNGPEYCYQLATRYSKQLFEIYQNKEDPFFCPC